ncbi:MAG: hypothetical protein F4Y60_13695 [Boseongicola sp. SB0664_bin_43]|uniref:Uncharacterized protein n=1 Tax=Boseongicola sp. SB0664_bin_43 TaxID=2604844 RepID=A0A6B0Y4S7_9RHOB|nr:hypothetical protein [Boseongicola sp. SB0664_bin_43]MYK30192.1 hypothetical protein [Boseongicola sp. SB0670_bin_30]
MPRYLVSYCLADAGKRDHEIMDRAIRALDNRAKKSLKSQWIIRSPKSLDDLFEYLRTIVDRSDRFLICRIRSNDAIWFNLIEIID